MPLISNFKRQILISSLLIILITNIFTFTCFAANSFIKSKSLHSVNNVYSTATLLSSNKTVAPNSNFWVALHLQLRKGWHSYWLNPGDSGLAPKLTWQLPNGFSAGSIHWLPPQRIQIKHLVNYGYKNSAYYLIPIQVGENLELGKSYFLHLNVDYLVCEESCVPESAQLTLPIVISTQSTASPYAALFQQLQHQLPQPLPTKATFTVNAETITLNLPLPYHIQNNKIIDAAFFPEQHSLIENASLQQFSHTDHHIQLTLDRSFKDPKPPFTGLLKLTFAANPNNSYYYRLSAENPTALGIPTVQLLHQWQFWQALLFALIGGIILNAMPCVFPILSLKALAISQYAHNRPIQARLHGLSYTLGVVISFIFLALVLIILQTSGQLLGWGFQMQSPIFIALLTYLMFLIALNLVGFFDVPTFLIKLGNRFANQQKIIGSFFTGILATLVATPCTAPFMGTAIGYAFTQPPLVIMLIFIALGFGLATPYLLISFIPPLMRVLPKPGAWMVTFKEFLAFPMFAATGWLLWVLAQQTGSGGLLIGISGLILIAFSLWLWQKLPMLQQPWRPLLAVLLIALCTYTVSFLHNLPANPISSISPAETFSDERLASLRASQQPVFVNVTAAWCITCKVNELALNNQSVQNMMKVKKMIYLVADWTNKNTKISEYLKNFNRRSVPLYVLYPPQSDPIVLLQILTPQILLKYFQKLV